MGCSDEKHQSAVIAAILVATVPRCMPELPVFAVYLCFVVCEYRAGAMIAATLVATVPRCMPELPVFAGYLCFVVCEDRARLSWKGQWHGR